MNGIFPITASNHINYQSGVMMAEAMKYAVQQVNKDEKYLHGYKIKINEIYDSVNESYVRRNILLTFVNQVHFLIGPYSSETSYISSILTRTFKQIAVSYSATYSDFDVKQRYMVRSVPSDVFRIQAAITVIQKLKWNYVGIICSYGYNGEREALHFISQLPFIGICVASQIHLQKQGKETSYIDAINTMNNDKRLKALVFFTTLDDSRLLLLAIQKLKLKGRFFILCMYGCTSYIEVVRGVENIADGMLSLDITNPEVPAFKEYFLKLSPARDTSRYFLDFWEDVFNCTLTRNIKNKCNGNEKLSEGRGYYSLTPVRSVIDAVYGIADAVKNMIEHVCDEVKFKKASKSNCKFNPIKHVDIMNTHLVTKIPKYEDGTIKYTSSKDKSLIRYDIHHYINHRNVLVGKWLIHRKYNSTSPESQKPIFTLSEIWNYLENGSIVQTHAFCSRKCPVGHIRIRDRNLKKQKCCWVCQKCPDHNIALNDTCIECKLTEKPDPDTATCSPLPRIYIKLNTFESWFISTLSLLGLATVSFVTIIFIRFNDNHIVRASGRDLCYLILFGVFLTFLCPFMFLLKPSSEACLLRGGLPGLAFICCYAPLFLRTNRIYRIFFHAKISVSRPSLVSSQSQLLVSCGIIAIQVLLIVVCFVSRTPSPQETVAVNNLYVNLHCKADNSPILLLANLALSVIFMISCTVLAFKTRHFPKNYNEAKYIGVTLYLSCVTWAVFFPGYFLPNPKTEFLREYLMCGICVAIGYITLFGLFGQKVRMLLCNNKSTISIEADTHPTWYLSEIEANDKHHPQFAECLTSLPTQDTLI